MTKPIKKFQAGTVSCALWENEISVAGKTAVLKASVQRRYKDKDGTWKSSSSFSRNEVPLAIYCLMQAFKTMVEGDTEGSGDNVEVEQVAD